jgi:hypothetical protein
MAPTPAMATVFRSEGIAWSCHHLSSLEWMSFMIDRGSIYLENCPDLQSGK